MRTADQPIRISLFAPNGRMGQAIAAAVEETTGFEIDQDHGDVLVDFSAPAALPASLDRAVSAGIPILIGTTGLDETADARLSEASRQIPVLYAPNTSVGVALLAVLVRRAAEVLGPDWDVEITETHHRMKADAPYQQTSPQTAVDFPPGTTWMAFTDQVSHAAMAGQYQLEQTFLLPVEAMVDERLSPLRILERLKGRRLV